MSTTNKYAPERLGSGDRWAVGVAAAAPPMTLSTTFTSPTTGTSAHHPERPSNRDIPIEDRLVAAGTSTVDEYSKADKADSGGAADALERGDKQNRQGERAGRGDYRRFNGTRDTNNIQHGTDRSDRR